MVDCATVFGPILKGTEVIDFPIAHILEHLSTQSGATAGRTIEDDYFVFSEILVVIWFQTETPASRANVYGTGHFAALFFHPQGRMAGVVGQRACCLCSSFPAPVLA